MPIPAFMLVAGYDLNYLGKSVLHLHFVGDSPVFQGFGHVLFAHSLQQIDALLGTIQPDDQGCCFIPIMFGKQAAQ